MNVFYGVERYTITTYLKEEAKCQEGLEEGKFTANWKIQKSVTEEVIFGWSLKGKQNLI